MDSGASSAEDNPFAAPKQRPAGKINVNTPTDDCMVVSKLDSLNLTLVQGYHREVIRKVVRAPPQAGQTCRFSHLLALWLGQGEKCI